MVQRMSTIPHPRGCEQDRTVEMSECAVDFGLFKPRASQALESARIGTDVVVRLSRDKYIKFTDAQFKLWQLMDGTRTIDALEAAYFGSLPQYQGKRLVSRLVLDLAAKGAIENLPSSDLVWHNLEAYLLQKNVAFKIRNGLRKCLQMDLRISNGWRSIHGLYRLGGRFCFHPVGFALIAVIICIGFMLMILAHAQSAWQRMDLMFNGRLDLPGLSIPSVVVTYLLVLVAVFFHEAGHALAVVHYGREVLRVSLRIHCLVFAGVCISTKDMWMKGVRERVIVSIAGPVASTTFGSVLFIGAWAMVRFGLNNSQLPYLVGAVGMLAVAGSLFNLNPFLLKMDGYNVLADLLGRPRLREEAFRLLKDILLAALRGKVTRMHKGGIAMIVYAITCLVMYGVVFGRLALWIFVHI